MRVRFLFGGGAGKVCSVFFVVVDSISLSAMPPCESESGLDLSFEFCDAEEDSLRMRLAVEFLEGGFPSAPRGLELDSGDMFSRAVAEGDENECRVTEL